MHIAFIPARKNSVGFKFKNRQFFELTCDFINKLDWVDSVILSTDDDVLIDRAVSYGYSVHRRSADLAGPAVPIKSVLLNVIEECAIPTDTKIWLFYLPILYKDSNDFTRAKEIIERPDVFSLCSFIPAKTHPYNCWAYNGRELSQYIENDVFRRQDLPPAWMHHHYLCSFKAGFINELNSELIGEKTVPMFIEPATAKKLVEVDTPEDFIEWKSIRNV